MQYRPIFTAFAVLLAMASHAGESVDRSLPTGESPRVEVENTRGDIAIKTWDKPEVRVTGSLDDEMEEFIFEGDEKTITIGVKTPKNVYTGEGSNLLITIPEKSDLMAQSVSTDFTIANVIGSTDVTAISGDVIVSGTRNKLWLHTTSGDITVRGHTGELLLYSVSGDQTLEGNIERIKAKSVSGDVILVNSGKLESGYVTSVSGDIEVESAFTKKCQLDMHAVSGDIEIKFTRIPDSRISVNTISGSIRNRLNDDEPEEKRVVGAQLETATGDGSGNISVSTVSGSILLGQ